MKFWILALLFVLGAPLWAQNDKPKPQPPTVNVGVGRDVAPGRRVQLVINTRNLPRVNVSGWRLDNPSWLLNRDRDGRSRPRVTGKADLFFPISVRDPKEKPNPNQIDVYRSRQINLPITRPGVYLLVASGGGREDWGVVNVTNLAVVAKRSPKRLLTWVTDFRSGQPLPGARVQLWNRSGNVVKDAAGTTQSDGTTIFPVAGGQDQIIVVRRGDDAAGVVVSNAEPDGKLKMHFQTDRPVYRPGHTVFWKAILRRTKGNGWLPIANQQCAVEVRDAKDIVIWKGQITTNARGTLDGRVSIPGEGAVGQYSVVITLPNEEEQFAAFTVAAYRKPEFKVEVEANQKRFLAGEEIKFKVRAVYYFDAPVPNATVRYTVRRAPLPLRFEDEEFTDYWYGGDGNLYDADSYGQNEVVADATADLDERGEAVITIPTDRSGGDATYVFNATVTDGARRQVAGEASAPVYAAAKRLSVRGEKSYVPLGFLMPLQLRVTDLEGQPTGGTVNLELQRPVWNEKEKRTRFQKVTQTSVQVPASGRANAKLPAQIEGTLRVVATLADGTGRTAKATWSFWVSGPRTQWPSDAPTVRVKPDKRAYKPGETMQILVSSNLSSRPILATIEGLDVWNYAVIPAATPSFVWKVKARVELSPNAFAAAASWSPNGLISDNATLPIPDPSRRLSVEIKADKSEYRPGETARYTLQTRDDSGKPVSAEVAVAVVDEAIYALRPDNVPDLYATFWANRENFVSTSASAPEEQSGGAFQRVGKTASVRNQFLDTAFWNARVETGANGRAVFEVKVPGNITMWRATARALTLDTQVGTAQSSVVATRPVTLRLATPRQFVVGDSLDLIVSVNNRTAAVRSFETALGADNLSLTGTTRTLRANPKGEARETWTVRANTLPDDGKAVLRGRTLASDATKENAEDASDALETSIPIVPNGVAKRLARGGTLENEATVALALPDDRIEPATTAKLTFSRGLGEVAAQLGNRILSTDRDSAPTAAARLLAVALLKPQNWQSEARENIALLSRYQTGQGGWNWWEDQQSDARVTAWVLSTLTRVRALGIDVPPQLVERGAAGAQDLYQRNPLWEERALLASALVMVRAEKSAELLAETRRRGENLSPFARLTLAEALILTRQNGEASQIARDVLRDANIGTDEAFVPVGVRDGWDANSIDATAAALSLLVQLQIERDVQSRLARWLAHQNGYASPETDAHRLRALWKYNEARPAARELGTIRVEVNGQIVPVPNAVEYRPLEVPISRRVWRDGENQIRLTRDGSGEIFWTLETVVYQPASVEVGTGVRVFRRYEAQNAALTWEEVSGAVEVGKVVRCTVVVWPDDRADALKVVEPIPAGWEYVDGALDYGDEGQTEVRDAAVVHYLHGHGLPVTFRYFLRSETTGRVTALPAIAEVVQRPETRGHSSSQTFVVKDEVKR